MYLMVGHLKYPKKPKIIPKILTIMSIHSKDLLGITNCADSSNTLAEIPYTIKLNQCLFPIDFWKSLLIPTPVQR